MHNAENQRQRRTRFLKPRIYFGFRGREKGLQARVIDLMQNFAAISSDETERIKLNMLSRGRLGEYGEIERIESSRATGTQQGDFLFWATLFMLD